MWKNAIPPSPTYPPAAPPLREQAHPGLKPLAASVLAQGLVLSGEIEGAQDLVIEGSFEGSIRLPESRVTIGAGGVSAADIEAREILVLGRSTGNLSASGRIELRSESIVSGDIFAARLIIEEGAQIGGAVHVFQTESLFSEVAKPRDDLHRVRRKAPRQEEALLLPSALTA